MRALTTTWRAFTHLNKVDGIEISGFLAYTALVSLFPFTIFLFTLAGFLGHADLAQQLIDQMLGVMPREVVQALAPILREILGKERPGLLTIGVLGTLWAAASGVEALRMGLNRAYRITEKRGFFKRRLLDVVFIAVSALCLLLASALIVAGPLMIQWAEDHLHLPLEIVTGLNIMRYLVTFGVLTAFFIALYRFLPDHRPTQTRPRLWPGALLASVLWTLIASLFSLYLAYFGSYDVTYGSLGGMVITLLFMQFSSLIFLLGADFNAELEGREEVPVL